MDEQKSTLPAAGVDSCAQNQKKPVKPEPKPLPETDRRDRLFLGLTFLFCVLTVDTVLFSAPGLGVTVTVAAWYLLAGSCRGADWLRRGEGRALLAVNLILAATFAVYSNWYFRMWNLGALLVLLPVHAFSGIGLRPWWQPSMLWERAGLLGCGLFENLPASAAALAGKREKSRRALAGALGLLAGTALTALLLPVLISADALFAGVTRDFVEFCRAHLTAGLARVLLGLAATPFVFGLLYALRRPKAAERKPEKPKKHAEALGILLLLGVLDGLYLLFLAVQGAGLIGGAEYLRQRGISYADWARSGFFQMVGVTTVNLAVTLTALRLTDRQSRGWRAVRALETLLIAESGLLLCSAAWRMSLYVGAYGLSFKRLMTYWGMGMMAVFLTAALLGVWREGFRFCRVAFAAAVLGWVLISCAPVDAIVARDGVDRYLAGEPSVDLYYLTNWLSFDAVRQTERLEGTGAEAAYQSAYYQSLSGVLEHRREEARGQCAQWESWNLSAWLLARESRT